MGHARVCLAHPAGNVPQMVSGLSGCVGSEALAAGPGAELGPRGGPASRSCCGLGQFTVLPLASAGRALQSRAPVKGGWTVGAAGAPALSVHPSHQ